MQHKTDKDIQTRTEKISEEINQKKYFVVFTYDTGTSEIRPNMAVFYANAFYDLEQSNINAYVKNIVSNIKETQKSILEININAENTSSANHSTAGTCLTENFLKLLMDECKKNDVKTFIINNLACNADNKPIGGKINEIPGMPHLYNTTVNDYPRFIMEYITNNKQCIVYYGCVYKEDKYLQQPSIVTKFVNENGEIKTYKYALFKRQMCKKNNDTIEYKDQTDFNSPITKNIYKLNKDIWQNSMSDVEKRKEIQKQSDEYTKSKKEQEEKQLKREIKYFTHKIEDEYREKNDYEAQMMKFEVNDYLMQMYNHNTLYKVLDDELYNKDRKKYMEILDSMHEMGVYKVIENNLMAMHQSNTLEQVINNTDGNKHLKFLDDMYKNKLSYEDLDVNEKKTYMEILKKMYESEQFYDKLNEENKQKYKKYTNNKIVRKGLAKNEQEQYNTNGHKFYFKLKPTSLSTIKNSKEDIFCDIDE